MEKGNDGRFLIVGRVFSKNFVDLFIALLGEVERSGIVVVWGVSVVDEAGEGTDSLYGESRFD